MENPEVSIIIPTYNREQEIKSTMSNALEQTYDNFEVIVIDDASKDNTEEVIKKIEAPRIRYIKHEENQGASAARNTGLKKAKGKYIAFLDSDDKWDPEKLEKQVKKIKESSPEVGVIYTGFWILMEDKKFLGFEPKKKGDIFEDQLLKEWISPPSCVLAKKECFEKVGGFDPNFPTREDYDMWIRISKYYHFDYIKEPLATIDWSYGPERRSTGGCKKHIEGAKRILAKHKNEILSLSEKKQERIVSCHYFNLGKRCWQNGNAKKGRQFIIKAIKIYPYKLKYYVILFFSAFGNRSYNFFATFPKKIRTFLKTKSLNFNKNS